MDDFSGQKVIVTGATRGIGKTIATAFLDGGAVVIGVYSSNDEAAEKFRSQCGDRASRLYLFKCDVSDHEAVHAFFVKIEQQFDAIDILVNNAGIRRDGVLAMMQQEDWQKVIDINLTGTFNMSKQAVMLMMKQKYGRIIHITSPMSRLGFAGQANYAASKAGQIGMMHSLAKEVAKRKITVNCVSPGFIDTELLDDLTPEQLSSYKKLVPVKRFGTTEEVAHAVLFLASPKSSYITGSVLDVTGGI
jgi:3-oxoacyl-[acyl-carrier protein] reductase